MPPVVTVPIVFCWTTNVRAILGVHEIGRLLHPSLGQFIYYITVNLLAIQLPRIVLEHLAGPASVAAFSVSVIYTRSIRMIVAIINQSPFMDFSWTYAEGKIAKARTLVNIISQASFWMSVIGAIVLITAAGPLFAIWTHGHVTADLSLIALRATGTLIGTYGDAFGILLININRVWSLALAFLFTQTGPFARALAPFCDVTSIASSDDDTAAAV